MRRQRSPHKTFAFLAVSLGVVVAPAAAHAATGDDSGSAASHSADAPPTPRSTSPATDKQPDPKPAPQPKPALEPTAPPTTQPAPTHPTQPARPRRAPAADHGSAAGPGAPASGDSHANGTQSAAADAGIDGITRSIDFPVLGPVRYSNDFGACRDGCARHHQGNDILGVRMQPLLAAVDGTITKIDLAGHGISGVNIRVTGDDGWYYNYFHVNNDTPGTDDGRATAQWQVEPGLTVGSRVRAGQIIGYMGDSGDAESSVPHLHFEIRTPDHTPVNPYHSLVAAQRRETCAGGTGAWTNTPLGELSPAAVAVIPLADGGRWVIDADGRLHAEGPAARIQPAPGVDCSNMASAVATPVVASATAPASAPTSDRWTVVPGDSLWHIAQAHYGVSGTAATVAVVNLVFAANRGELADPNRLTVGMRLVLPPRSV